jgi:tetratricopeptide (TPR) repeat protein
MAWRRREDAGYEDAAGIAEPTIDVMGQLDMLFDAKALHSRAEVYSRRCLAIAEARFDPNDPRIAIRLNNLAELLRATNRLGGAELQYRRALAIDEASFGRDHPAVAIALNNHALLLRDTNRLGEAEPLSRRALAIFLAFECATGHAHPHRDVAIRNHAGLLAAMGKNEADIAAAITALRRDAGPGPA